MTTLRLLFRQEYADQGFAPLVKTFQARHPDVKIQITIGSPELDAREEAYRNAFQNGQPFDLLYIDQTSVAEFASHGWIRPLDDVFAKTIWESFSPEDRAACRWDDRLYRVPYESDFGLIYYRKDILEKAGVKAPRSWEELVQTARKLQRPPDLWGHTWQGAPYEGLVVNFLEALWSQGQEWDGKTLDPRVLEPGVSFMRGLLHESWVSPIEVLQFRERESAQHFLDGKSIFHRNWPALWSWVERTPNLKGRVGLLPIPPMKPGGSGVSVLGGMGFALAKDAPKEAQEFLQFCFEPESHDALCGSLGLWTSVASRRKSLPVETPFASLRRGRPQHPAYRAISQRLQAFLTKNLR